MNVLSLFDGMSCGRIALGRAKVNVNKYFSSEIKPIAIKVANYNYPLDAEYRLGDVTKIDPHTLPKINLLIGGSPCQDFSLANKTRLGVQGEIGVKPIRMNSKLVSPCSRSRLYWTNIPIKEPPADKNLLLNDILTGGVTPIGIKLGPC